MDPFAEVSLIIGLTVLLAIILRVLRQPLIVSYILAGILAGPSFFNVLRSQETITLFSHLGVALLLFIVGLNLNPKIIKDVGKVSLITGLGQVLFTVLLGYGLALGLGFSWLTSFYIAIGLSFSSTIVIMKLLSDKGDTEKLYGRISIGFLIVQDLIAIVILMVMSSLKTGASTLLVTETIFKIVGLLLSLFLIGYFILPRLTASFAKSQELLLLFALGWAFVVSALFTSLGFTIEIGAFLAGVLLSLSPYRYEISCKLRPLRDFFLVIFFILLGSQMAFANIQQHLWAILLFSLLVLIGNPLIVMTIMGIMGYTKRTSFFAGLTVAQISEFSWIVMSLALVLGHVSPDALSIITAVGLLTIALSSYLIQHAERIYAFLSPGFSIFERRGEKVDNKKYHHHVAYEALLFGYNSIGHDLVQKLQKMRKRFLVVDYNPDTVVALAKEGIECRYGDANDSELLNDLNLSSTRMVISTITSLDTNLFLLGKLKDAKAKAIFIAVSHDIDEAMELYDHGASYVIMPHFLGGHHAAALIEKHGFSVQKFMDEQVRHLRHLKGKRKLGHEHPKPLA
ncbi:cation:proton antiporter [Candidatus Woesearchaeota archaeon]|nr:cation:proton antiporter [Candidatus Woesearchaeota archaeon]